MVDVHLQAARDRAREATEAAQSIQQLRRTGEYEIANGNVSGGESTLLLFRAAEEAVGRMFLDAFACREEYRVDPKPSDDDEPDGSDVEIPGPWTL